MRCVAGWSFFVVIVAWLLPELLPAQVAEIPNSNLQNVSYATKDAYGRPVIYYNPRLCRLYGPEVCAFAKAHEYGHIALGHLNRPINPSLAEAEADCWAARYASPNSVAAALRYFATGRGFGHVHGSAANRAARVQACFDMRPRVTTQQVERMRPLYSTNGFGLTRTPTVQNARPLHYVKSRATERVLIPGPAFTRSYSNSVRYPKFSRLMRRRPTIRRVRYR